MNDFLVILIDECDTVIFTYRVTARDRASALNEFAQFVVSDIDLRDIVNNTKQIRVGELKL